MRWLVLTMVTAFIALACPKLVDAQLRRPLPVVQRLAPTSGPPGAEVTLHGRYFDEAQTIWVGAECEVVSRSPSRWTIRIPAEARTGPVEIRTARGNVMGPRFRVSPAPPPPTVTRFAPRSGAPGTEVVISGEGFSPRAMENVVHLGETPVVVQSATPTELRIVVPEGAASGTFRARVQGGSEAASRDTFEVAVGTAITAFEPSAGPARTRVTLRGTGFHRSRGRVRVQLGEVRARVLRASETELVVEVPRRGAVSGRWRVEIRGGGTAYSEARFDVRSPPEISTMEPAFGAPGSRITLRGAHFGNDIRRVEATLGDGQTMTPRDLADDRLVLEIPQGAQSGRVAVTVGGLGPARTRGTLRITETLSVTAFSPRSGPAGSEITVAGRGFSADTSHDRVTVGGAEAEVVRATETELVVRVPETRSGPLRVEVVGGGAVTTREPFVVTTLPSIASVTPTSAAPGTTISIRGQNFGSRVGLVRVQIGETQLTVESVADGEIVARLPADARSGVLRVTVRLHGSASVDGEFTVLDEPPSP